MATTTTTTTTTATSKSRETTVTSKAPIVTSSNALKAAVKPVRITTTASGTTTVFRENNVRETVAETTVSDNTTTTITAIETAKITTVTEQTFTEKFFSYVPTTQEMDMMCTVVSSEAGYCEDYMQKAVAHTIINRIYSAKFPNTIYEILTQRNQYTCISNYFYGTYRQGLAPGSAAWQHSMQLCYEAMSEWDFTGGAVAYYNPQMIGYNSWFEQFQCTYQNKYGRFFAI